LIRPLLPKKTKPKQQNKTKPKKSNPSPKFKKFIANSFHLSVVKAK
jgi:hypothetical protein